MGVKHPPIWQKIVSQYELFDEFGQFSTRWIGRFTRLRGDIVFEFGLEYVRVDFHLHTKKDKEFQYSDVDNNFVKNYVNALKQANIKVGVVTNHNKFDREEFRALRKAAKKEDIFLLPGVELAVKEGANGIHTLIVFNPEEWFEEDHNHIQNFLSQALAGISNPENKNSKSVFDLKKTLETLDSYNRDYFVIFAHVDQNNGLFKECKTGLMKALSNIATFKKRVLGLQKLRTRTNIEQFKQCFGYLPALVEGSDPKTIEEIGKGSNHTYIKIGDFSYSSVKFALQDYHSRVNNMHPEIKHGFIESISFKGGKFDGQKITFSPHLNTIIGIRGSGKSSIIEIIRFIFDVSPQTDRDYKEDLVKNVLGSGGKVVLTLINKYGKRYTISRILGERTNIIDENGTDLNIHPGSLLEGIQYFGQKDLSTITDHESTLLDTMVMNISEDTTTLNNCFLTLKNSVEHLLNAHSIPEEIENKTTKKSEIEHKMAVYQEKGVAQKLKKQTAYFADKTKLTSIREQLNLLLNSMRSIHDAKPSLLNIVSDLESEYNNDLIDKVNSQFDSWDKQWSLIGTTIHSMQMDHQKFFDDIISTLDKRIESFSDEFAEIKREIKNDTLNADDFVKMSKDLESLKLQLRDLNEKFNSKKKLETTFFGAMRQRNEVLLNIFNLYKTEIKRINNTQDKLRIEITFKGDKENFKEQLKADFKGTSISDIKYQKIVEKFSDYVDIISDWLMSNGEKLRSILSITEYNKMVQKLTEQYDELLKNFVKDKVEIYYHGKLLKQHSIGQRASALILFILTQTNNDIIVIDQPEDDLDNKVIYDEVIKAIVNKKEHLQFIFATHNANIPVLGDSERIFVVNYQDTTIDIFKGNIDCDITQQQIVEIMEGGKEAFHKRQLIYNAWNQ